MHISEKSTKIISLVLFILVVIISLFFILRPATHSEWLLMSGTGPKCLDVAGGQVTLGARIIGYDCHGGINQRFDITMDGGTIKVGKLCLDASNASFDNGAELILWTCHNGTNQNWIYDEKKNRLLNYYSKCVDLEGGEKFFQNTQKAILWDCNDLPNQKWFLSKTVLDSKVVGGKRIFPNIQTFINPPKDISAGRNGILYNENDERILPSNEMLINAASDETVVNISNNRVIVPAKKLK